MPVNQRRILALVVLSVVALVSFPGLIALAALIDHRATRWLIAAALAAGAVGMAATLAWRLVFVVGDQENRQWWWNDASTHARLVRAIPLVVRMGTAVLLLALAIRQLYA